MTVAIVCAPELLYFTVPVPASNVPPVLVVDPPIIRVLELPDRAPVVLVHAPVKVWVSPVPRSKVPFDPFIVSPAPLTLPVNVAIPPVFDMVVRPVVVYPAIDCVPAPPIVTGDALAVNVPLLMKFPPKVTE